MKDKLREYLQSKDLNEGSIGKLMDMSIFKTYNVGDTILDIGQHGNYICLILHGIVRGFYLDEDGNEITKCFSTEGEWCCTYNYFSNEPSGFIIQAVERCEVAQFDVTMLQSLIKDNDVIRDIRDEIMRDAFLESEKRVLSFSEKDATKRYLDLQENRPLIVARVKQEYIASYLGITPSSLSRIKRSLVK